MLASQQNLNNFSLTTSIHDERKPLQEEEKSNSPLKGFFFSFRETLVSDVFRG